VENSSWKPFQWAGKRVKKSVWSNKNKKRNQGPRRKLRPSFAKKKGKAWRKATKVRGLINLRSSKYLKGKTM